MDRRISELRDEYPWGSLGNATVVDVGGGSGHVSMSLARVGHYSLFYPDMIRLISLGISGPGLHRARHFPRHALSVSAAADR